ncbi:fungal-specific transcription factor domain-containing protein [Acrodontium crateriforme]|uniref:Fungal-specific transcription factor domain-containing protein n=1 Tax=Acrodontium crateriforme TaxID=150365 RepID=A0AAQ3LY46_9PEZI|nr:fungal-specific transcription factor domain-containing protein [Acrodontium crateriforme]
MENAPHGAVGEQPAASSSSPGPATDDGPACLSCRHRKLKCDRERPACSQCLRLVNACVYDPKKQKPGLKTGAVEGLNRRLESVERTLDAFLSEWNAAKASKTNPFATSAELFPIPRSNDTPTEYTPPAQDGESSRKRRRITLQSSQSEADNVRFGLLPPQSVIDRAIDKYYATVYHWIPMLHQARFRSRLNDPTQRPHLTIVLHAIIAVTLRHLGPDEVGLSQEDVNEQIRRSTNAVVQHAMLDLSVENTQALIMICFDKMGAGQWNQVWSIIGSLTRVVDYLQLSVEPDEDGRQCLLAPLTLLDEPQDNAELEERKRVFWNIFLLDRFCSVTCGWTTALNSDNVSRQLPCNGQIWALGQKAKSPYLGLWNKSQAKMGNSVAYLPTRTDRRRSGDEEAPGEIDTSSLGAVAYRIEATESLSQVSAFFLQQRVDFTNRAEIGKWLTRFKELDLRLVHWKLFLPERWKDSNVSKTPAAVKMDPNLTLAHVIHNISLILLHQHIAYAPVALSCAVNLPSASSSETCRQAAIEVASMTQKYLHYTKEMMVGAEFVFCAFVAAKVLLVHSLVFQSELVRDFYDLIDHLREMSRRWRSLSSKPSPQSHGTPSRAIDLDVAGQYASRLEEFQTMSAGDSNNVAYILFCSGANGLLRSPPSSTSSRQGNGISHKPNSSSVSPSINSMPQPGTTHVQLGAAYPYPHHSMRSVSVTAALPSVSGNYLGSMSIPAGHQAMGPPAGLPLVNIAPSAYANQQMLMPDMLWDQSFTNLDRIITSTEADFSFDENFNFNVL